MMRLAARLVRDIHFVPPETFNRLFTMHGTTMVFLVGMPDRVRLRQLSGAADDRGPRPGLPAPERLRVLDPPVRRPCCSTSASRRRRALRRRLGARVGWFAYAPLTERAFIAGNATDYWNLALLVTGFGTIATAINLIATILTMRGPGMTLGRMPLFVWEMLTISAHDPAHPAAAVGGPDHAAPRPLPGGALLRHAGGRLGHRCGSTSSGSSAIPRSTS